MKFQKFVVSGASGNNGFETMMALLRKFPRAQVVGLVRPQSLKAVQGKWSDRREMQPAGRNDPILTADPEDAVGADVWINFRGKNLQSKRQDPTLPPLEEIAQKEGVPVRELLLEDNLPMALEDFELAMNVAPGCIYMQEGNPVDSIVRRLALEGKTGPEKIVSTGAMMEWYRFLSLCAVEFDIELTRASGLYIGGHGETSVEVPERILFGVARVDEYVRDAPMKNGQTGPERLQVIRELVKYRAKQLSQITGATPYYGPSQAAADLVGMMNSPTGRHTNVGVCRYHARSEHYGFEDAALSLPGSISPEGFVRLIEIELSSQVRDELNKAIAEIQAANRYADRVRERIRN